MFNVRKILVLATFLLTLFGCNSTPLKYTLDPEFSYLQELGRDIKIVSVRVVDKRQNTTTDSVKDPDEVASKLQNQLIQKLKDKGYKIINKPLLADIAYEMVINELDMAVDKSMFKSLIRGNSKITLTLRKHSDSVTKIFSATKTQEVANPANSIDVTGVANQMLSNLFANMFSDQQIVEFSEKSQ